MSDDAIEAAIDAFWRSAKGYSPGDSIAKDMRAAIVAYLLARADEFEYRAAVDLGAGRKCDVCQLLAAEVERGENRA